MGIQIALIGQNAPADGAGVAERGSHRLLLQLLLLLLLLIMHLMLHLFAFFLCLAMLQLDVHASRMYGMKAQGAARHGAAVGFLARMQTTMHGQIIGKAIPLATDVTLMWPLLGVDHSVHAQLAQLAKSLAALLAHMWPLIRVRHAMDAQRVGITEAARADVANVVCLPLGGRGTFAPHRNLCGLRRGRWRRRRGLPGRRKERERGVLKEAWPNSEGTYSPHLSAAVDANRRAPELAADHLVGQKAADPL